MKLVMQEAESPALRAAAATWPAWITSVITEVEVRRALARERAMHRGAATAASDDILARTVIVAITPGVIAQAGGAEPPSLRSLDAIHLGTALHLGDGIDAFCTYDRRLGTAATAAGLTVLAPA